MRKHPIAPAVVIAVIASAIGIALALWIDWFPVDAATQAAPIDTLYDVLMIVSVPIFVLVVTVILYCVWAFRMRPGQEHEDGPPIHGNTRLEVVWTAVPAIILVSLCSYAYAVLHDIEKTHQNELIVNVTGVQFAWKYSYPQEDGGKPIASDKLYLPVDRPVRFNVRSEDVIHDFWVPAFRMKIDAVPGITTNIRVTPTKTGAFAVVCAELCGLGHSVMRSTAYVVSPSRFEDWLAKQSAPPAAAGGGGGSTSGGGDGGGGTVDLAAIGKETFTGAGTCGACHKLADAGTTGTTGPDLDQVLNGASEDEIRTDIVDPGAEVPDGYQDGIMPADFGDRLSQQQLDGLVTYLATVSK